MERSVDYPKTGTPQDYQEGTPEQKFAEFMSFWKQKNYGHMAKCVPINRGATQGEMPKELRLIYGDVEVVDFEITEIEDTAAAATNIHTNLRYKRNQKTIEKNYTFRLLFMDEDGRGSIRGNPNCQWYVFNWQYFY